MLRKYLWKAKQEVNPPAMWESCLQCSCSILKQLSWMFCKKTIQNFLNWWACDSGNSMPAMHRLRHVFLTTGRIPCVCCDAFYRLSEMCIWSMWNLGTTIEDISVYLPHSQRSFKHRGPFIPPSIKLSLLKHVNLESPMKKTKPFRQFPNFPLVHK